METPELTNEQRFSIYRQNPTVENRNKLVEHFLPDCTKLARAVANRYRCCTNTKEEFVSEATIILIKTVERYDYTIHDNFIGYLYFCLCRRLRQIMKKRGDRQKFASVGTFGQEAYVETEDYRTSESEVAESEDSEIVREAKQFLGRDLYECRFVHKMTLDQVADKLNMKRSTVNLRIQMFAQHAKRKFAHAS